MSRVVYVKYIQFNQDVVREGIWMQVLVVLYVVYVFSALAVHRAVSSTHFVDDNMQGSAAGEALEFRVMTLLVA